MKLCIYTGTEKGSHNFCNCTAISVIRQLSTYTARISTANSFPTSHPELGNILWYVTHEIREHTGTNADFKNEADTSLPTTNIEKCTWHLKLNLLFLHAGATKRCVLSSLQPKNIS